MKGKVDEKRKAVDLRKNGYSINEISKSVGVSKGTASLWLRDVILSHGARERLVLRSRLGPVIAAEKRRHNRDILLQKHDNDARDEVLEYNLEIPCIRAMSALIYWCEGAKDSSSGIAFTNSDRTYALEQFPLKVWKNMA
jgi:hypothetical protein